MIRYQNPRSGISLFEVLIVISIMSISLLLALPAVGCWQKWAEQTRIETALGNSIQQARQYAVENGTACQIRPDRVNRCLIVEQIHGTEIEKLASVSVPHEAVIQLSKTKPQQPSSAIDIDPHGLFVHEVLISVLSGGQMYLWKTDRQSGSIIRCSK